MKPSALLALSAHGALGHYFFANTVVGGTQSGPWEFIRETANNPGSGPIEDVTSDLMACYEKAGRPAAAVQTVAAGTQVGFTASASMGHPGPSLFYMAHIPDGADADAWVPSGDVWFKIDQYGNLPGVYPPFETEMTEISTTIPASLSPGTYLLRAEHIALHINGAPQFYLSCAQVEVTGGGTAVPSSLVAFPGAYAASDPGLVFNIYAENGAYPYPGPEVWS